MIVQILIQRRLRAKSMGISKAKAIVLGWSGVDSILRDQADPEIFYFEHDSILIFIGNSDVSNIGKAILILQVSIGNAAIRLVH